MAWESGTVPTDWRKAQIVPVHKKGSRTQCKNYRGISLLSVPGKVYATVLDKRIRAITEEKVLEEQGAFRRKRSCIDQIFTVRQLGEKVIGKNKIMRMVCVDLEKAFDRVNRELLWQVLERYGVRGRLKEAVESLYFQSEACVRVQGKNSEWFEVAMGVRQGCTMSPWLFNLVMDSIVREAREKFQGGVQLESSKVQFLLFADDLVIVAENEEDIKRNAEVLNEVMAKWKMRINWQKTKVMVVQRGGGTCHLVVDDVEVEAVQTTKYLGAMFNDEASCDDEIENRIGTATRMVGALRRQVIERKELSKATKLRVINAMVVPTLLYGSETWTLQKRHRSKIQAMEMRYLRRIEGVSRLDRIPNEDIRRRLGVEAVLAVADRKKKEWRERIEGMSQERLVRRVFEEDVCGRRPRGRPRKKWIDDME